MEKKFRDDKEDFPARLRSQVQILTTVNLSISSSEVSVGET